MIGYLELARTILDFGEHRSDRTGHGTVSLFGQGLRFDLNNGFPAVTTKKLAFGQVTAELAAFLAGAETLQEFEEFGCRIWKANAVAPYWLRNPKRRAWLDGDLGRIYGVQWRQWRGLDDEPVDQLAIAIDTLRRDPWSRRAVVTAWNPTELDEVCLPPCHTMFQFSVRNRDGVAELDCAVTMRSVDVLLGMPFDIASYALLTHIVAQQLALAPGVLVMWFGDTHVYNNHTKQMWTQLKRKPYRLPKLQLDATATVDNFSPEMAVLVGYEHHPGIEAEMNI